MSSWGLKIITGTMGFVLATCFLAILPLGCVNNPTDPIVGMELFDDDYGEIIESTQLLRGKVHWDEKDWDGDPYIAYSFLAKKVTDS